MVAFRLACCLCLAFATSFHISNALGEDADKTIIAVYDHYPPSTIIPSDDEPRRGFANDMLRDIFEKAEYTVVFKEQPLARALETMASGGAHVYPEIIKPLAPSLLYPESPTFNHDYVIWVKNDGPWVYNGADSLRGRRVGNVVGYEFGHLDKDYDAFILDEETDLFETGGTDAISRLFQMLDLGRIDMYCESYLVGQYEIAKLGLSGKVRPAGVLPVPIIVYPGFSPTDPRSEELLAVWDAGRRELQAIGRDKLYLEAYGIDEAAFSLPSQTD